MSFYNFRNIKSTRKQFVCWWCGEVIPKGSRAIYAAGLGKDIFWDGRTHLECNAAVIASPYEEDGFGEHEHIRGSTERKDDHDAGKYPPPEFAPDGNRITP